MSSRVLQESTDSTDGQQNQVLSFDADALNILWTDVITGTVADENSDCPINLSVKTVRKRKPKSRASVLLGLA